jgi:hypothetical protein
MENCVIIVQSHVIIVRSQSIGSTMCMLASRISIVRTLNDFNSYFLKVKPGLSIDDSDCREGKSLLCCF